MRKPTFTLDSASSSSDEISSHCSCPFASLPVWQRNLGSEQSDQSLCSLLLEIETRLRAEVRGEYKDVAKDHGLPEYLGSP